jgi:hypothetical protein
VVVVVDVGGVKEPPELLPLLPVPLVVVVVGSQFP